MCKGSGNSVHDLRSGELRKHNPNDFFSKKAYVTFNPEAKCERWLKFIDEVMLGDSELALYLQKAVGYGISGDVSEECLFILYGATTRNGKGTFVESILNTLGDYAKTAQPDTLAQRKANGGRTSADIARLVGVRFLSISELPCNMKLNAALVKQLTGGDTITARLLYKNHIEFKVQFKAFINTNHLADIDDDTLFSSRRLRMIPFDRHFDESEQDRGLKAFFREENCKSAILNWLLKGYLRYKAEGLVAPARVDELLREYGASCDSVGLYVENRLIACNEKSKVGTAKLHTDFLKWCEREGINSLSPKEFVGELRKKNLLGRDGKVGHFIRGYRLP